MSLANFTLFKMIRILPLIFSLAVIISGCHSVQQAPQSSQFDELIIGMWREDFGSMGTAINTFEKDGQYYGWLSISGLENPVTFKGTWAIYKNVLSYTVTESSDPGYPYLGKETRDEILELNDSTFKYRSLDFDMLSEMKKIPHEDLPKTILLPGN